MAAPRAITEEEIALFDAIVNAPSGSLNPILVSTCLDGEQTAAIAMLTSDGDEFVITPVAILVTDAMFDRLTEPGEGL